MANGIVPALPTKLTLYVCMFLIHLQSTILTTYQLAFQQRQSIYIVWPWSIMFVVLMYKVVSGSCLSDHKETRGTCCRSCPYHSIFFYRFFRNKICEGCLFDDTWIWFSTKIYCNPNVSKRPNTILMSKMSNVSNIGTFSSKRMVTFTAPPETWRASSWVHIKPQCFSHHLDCYANAMQMLCKCYALIIDSFHFTVKHVNPSSFWTKGLWNSHISLLAMARYVSLQSSSAYQGCSWRRFGIPRYRAAANLEQKSQKH